MRTAGYTWTDYKTNSHIAKELEITPFLDKLLEYKRNWIQHVNRMPRDRLPRIMKHYSPTGRRNRGRPLKRLLDTWDRNGSTSSPTPWQTYDDDDDDDDVRNRKSIAVGLCNSFLVHVRLFGGKQCSIRDGDLTLRSVCIRGDQLLTSSAYRGRVQTFLLSAVGHCIRTFRKWCIFLSETEAWKLLFFFVHLLCKVDNVRDTCRHFPNYAISNK